MSRRVVRPRTAHGPEHVIARPAPRGLHFVAAGAGVSASGAQALSTTFTPSGADGPCTARVIVTDGRGGYDTAPRSADEMTAYGEAYSFRARTRREGS